MNCLLNLNYICQFKIKQRLQTKNHRKIAHTLSLLLFKIPNESSPRMKYNNFLYLSVITFFSLFLNSADTMAD